MIASFSSFLQAYSNSADPAPRLIELFQRSRAQIRGGGVDATVVIHGYSIRLNLRKTSTVIEDLCVGIRIEEKETGDLLTMREKC